MEIFAGELRTSDLTKNANGGSEQILRRLHLTLNPELLKQFHVVNSRLESSLDHRLFKIVLLHDLPWDPASDFLKDGGWQKFDRLVFVSNWQMQQYCATFNIPYSKCVVMLNAIDRVENVMKQVDSKIRIGYWSTPHRGLEILYQVFVELAKTYPQVHLDVFSSFNLYGWGDRDAPYKDLFTLIDQHEQATYHGTVDNSVVRNYARTADIFAYPSIWPETSCICLIEAMSAGLLCVHPNLAALYETAANHTQMYQWQDNIGQHAKVFAAELERAILTIDDRRAQGRQAIESHEQMKYANRVHTWGARTQQWNQLLQDIIANPRRNTITLSTSS